VLRDSTLDCDCAEQRATGALESEHQAVVHRSDLKSQLQLHLRSNNFTVDIHNFLCGGGARFLMIASNFDFKNITLLVPQTGAFVGARQGMKADASNGALGSSFDPLIARRLCVTMEAAAGRSAGSFSIV